MPPQVSAPIYVEMMGGPAKITTRGKELMCQGRYDKASAMLNKLVFAQPGNPGAKDLLANTLEPPDFQK